MCVSRVLMDDWTVTSAALQPPQQARGLFFSVPAENKSTSSTCVQHLPSPITIVRGKKSEIVKLLVCAFRFHLFRATK